MKCISFPRWAAASYIIFGIIACKPGFSQPETQLWYFGNRAGLDFSSCSDPTPMLNAPFEFQPREGGSCATDANGNLLFYATQERMFNASHQIMLNGDSVTTTTQPSSAPQGVLILPDPGNTDRHYIFQMGYNGSAGHPVKMSIIDMTLDGGMGGVVLASKGTVVYDKAGERMNATKHANGRDYWIAMHKKNAAQFDVFLLSPAGLSVPQTFTIGAVPKPGNGDGQMKFSPNGKLLGMMTPNTAAELFSFDNATGTISNLITLHSGQGLGKLVGCEFSPDNSKFYISKQYVPIEVYQFDLNASNIPASMTLAGVAGRNSIAGCMALGPDCKIYITGIGLDSLYVINDPNELGTACNFSDKGPYLGGRKGTVNLPNLVNYRPHVEFLPSDTSFCAGNQLTLTAPTTTCGGYLWSNGATTQSISVSGDNTYTVEVTSKGCSRYDTIDVEVLNAAIVDLGPDTSICSGTVTLDAGTSSDVLWSTGEVTQTITVSTTGEISVEIGQGLCAARDTILITAGNGFDVETNVVISDSCDRFGSTIGTATATAQGGTGPFTYLWDDGQTTPTAIGLGAGTHTVTITDDAGCTGTDQFVVEEKIQIGISIDVDPCDGCGNGEVTVNVAGTGLAPYSYRWNDPSDQTTATATGLSPGTYVVIVTDSRGCFNSDTVSIGPFGIEDENWDSGISIFPNPASEYLNIKTQMTGKTTYSVISTLGQSVVTGTLNEAHLKLSLHNLSSGIYILRLDNNGRSVFQRFDKL